jgi:hypothetical protein
VALPGDDAFLDVENEGATRLQHAQQLLADGGEPRNVIIGIDTAVSIFAAVGVRRRGNDQIDRIAG